MTKRMKFFQKEKKVKIRLKFKPRRKKPGRVLGSVSLGMHRKLAKDHGSQKSPRVRFLMKLDAERDCRIAPKTTCIYFSVKELFKRNRPRTRK